MPPHKAKFRWRSGPTSHTDYEVVENEFGRFRVGGTYHRTRSASRGGVHVASIESTWKLADGPGMICEGSWILRRADGSVHSSGQIDGRQWGPPHVSDEILEEITAGA